MRPHPHIGLATVTYLFEGEILHRDSLGTAQPIRPGEVNWMTAGRGIVHSERPRRTAPPAAAARPAAVGRAAAHLRGNRAHVHAIAADDIPAWRDEPGVSRSDC